MARKLLSCLVSLLLLQLVPLSLVQAEAGSLPAAVVSKPENGARSGDAGKVDANWDRDLFAIFREGDEAGKSAPTAVGSSLKKSAAAAIAPKKFAVPRELKLQGIVFSDDGHATALVDGKIVRSGEMLDGWLVRRITRHGLLLEDNVGRREYELLAGSARAMVHSCAIAGKE